MRILLAISILLICSCGVPKFIVTDKTVTNGHNELATAKPINHKAKKMGIVSIMVSDTVMVDDTIKLFKDSYTNY